MAATYWYKQDADKPLFIELLWSKPENKNQAGKLLIIGGNSHGFAAPAEAYSQAIKSGIGTARVLLPDVLKKLVGRVLENCDFVSSTPSGSFAQNSLADLLASTEWADAVLIAGDLGRNSETAIVLEKFMDKFKGALVLTKDAVDYIVANPLMVNNRDNSTLVLSIAQLQKLASGLKYPQTVTFDMALIRLVDMLHDFSQSYPLNIIVKHLDTIVIAVQGQVSTTKLKESKEIWRVQAAATAAVWWLQNPSKIFEALTTAIVQIWK